MIHKITIINWYLRVKTVNEVQVTHEAVADTIIQIITNEQEYIDKSFAVVEPETTYGKPPFY